MIYILSIIFVLSILVFFHELGHFLFAKIFGVRVERFSIGFPPRLFGVKLGETDYCISAIPFGGYVKMSGVIDESMDKTELTGAPHEFSSKTWWQKMLILVGGVTMNMILAWIILSGLLHFEGERSYPSTTVGYMVQGGISEAAGIQLGDQILSINNTPVQNWNDVREQYISHLGDRMVFRVKRGEEIREIIFNKDILSQETAEQLDLDPRLPAMVGDIKAESPASKAGLQRGDRILSIAGTPVDSWDEMTDIIRSNPDKPLKFEIMHNNEKLSTTITPAPVTGINAQGEEQVVGQIGVEIYYDKKSLALFPALTEGIDQTFFITGLNIKGLWWLVSGQKSAKDMLGGPIMITKMAGDMAKISFSSLMFLIANLSIMLAIINILPIPALDGGHITIVLIEEIRRKPLTTGTKLKIQQVGMAILFVLIAFVMYNDIIKLF